MIVTSCSMLLVFLWVGPLTVASPKHQYHWSRKFGGKYVCEKYNLPVNTVWTQRPNCEASKQYKCRRGYQSQVQTNCKGGLWHLEPICQAAVCPPGTHITNSDNVTQSRIFGEEFSFKCLDGYTLTGLTGTMACDVNGNWTVRVPCEAVVCSPGENITNSDDVTQSRIYGEVFSFKCLDRFTTNGRNGTMTCDANGNWTVRVPCETYDVFGPFIRLVDGTLPNSGRLEHFTKGSWRTQCDNEFDQLDAKVVCRQLNLPFSNALPLPGVPFGEGTVPILSTISDCIGTETALSDCLYSQTNYCYPDEIVSVICREDAPSLNDVKVRLVDGPSELNGRLEVFYAGLWGTVCEHAFDQKAAKVVCRMLNVTDPTNATVIDSIYTPGGYGKGIWLAGVKCTGNETSIADCPDALWGKADFCTHVNDIGVNCQ